MALDWGICFQPFAYTGRSTRFVIEYSAWNKPISTLGLTSYYRFVKRDDKRRVSFSLPEGAAKRCQIVNATRLVTDHPSAEQFLNDFKSANPQVTNEYIRYYVMDDNGTDIPIIPSINDITSQTGINEIKDLGTNILTLGVIGSAGYYAYKKLWKKKGKKK
ncbi:hypothetical protein [Leptospira bouyouniensis]|uniref:Uncharacterized protein n=1 Tax=Leptospira bouyouniensis TaxID=2484911 RepID=A0ABY2L9A9_9LEPT|nr:hypothetical protein [Leptospira bouyouniensis]TGK53233.1 hypothetical protein EHQ10_05690 [Leptospira bouyouniensis]